MFGLKVFHAFHFGLSLVVSNPILEAIDAKSKTCLGINVVVSHKILGNWKHSDSNGRGYILSMQQGTFLADKIGLKMLTKNRMYCMIMNQDGTLNCKYGVPMLELKLMLTWSTTIEKQYS